jgi:long-chain fatty acid transport protein
MASSVLNPLRPKEGKETAMKRIILTISVCALCILTMLDQASAIGFRAPNQGNRAANLGGAFVGVGDDPSTVWYNPAGMTNLDGTQYQQGVFYTLIHTRVDLAAGGTASNKQMLGIGPMVYLTSNLKTERLRFGFGFNAPFGQRSDWGNTNPFRTAINRASLRLLNFNPSLAYQLTPTLSVGVGFNASIADVHQSRGLAPVGLFGGNDIFVFEGSGHGFGYNAGVMWKPRPEHTFGISYRSKMQIDFDGTATIVAPPGFVPATGKAHAGLNFPQIIMVGYSYRPNDKWLFAVGIDWTDWNQLNSLDLRSDLPPANVSVGLHWKSSFLYQFGVEHAFNEQWIARFGYVFSENSVPDATFNPVTPDSDRHVFNFGFTYRSKSKKFEFHALYQFTYGEERVVTGTSYATPPFPPTTANGTYKTTANTISLGVTRRF